MSEENKIVSRPDFSAIVNDKERVDTMCRWCVGFRSVDADMCLDVASEAKELSARIGYKKGLGHSLMHIGFQHWHKSEIDRALEEVREGRRLILETDSFDLLGDATMVKAMIIWGNGAYDQAFNLVYSTLNILEEKKEEVGVEWMYWCLGVFYYDLKDYDKSLMNYNRVMTILQQDESPEPGFLSYTLIGLGSVNCALEKYEEALAFFEQSREISKSSGHWMEEARSHYEIGNIFKIRGNNREAELAIRKSYQMRHEHNTKPGMVSSLILLSEIKVEEGLLDEAMQLMNEALSYAEETKTKPKIYLCHQKLAELYRLMGNFEKAYIHLERFYELKTQVAGDKANNLLKDLETRYATEKAEKEKEIHRLKNVELKKANDEIASKNEKIISSIKYAKRLQEAILPPMDLIHSCLPDSFVLYKPKDIVAGDFYWLEQKGGKIFFAVADCTGHGVPGALVSVICNNALYRSVNESGLTDAGKILGKVREIVVEVFEKSVESVQDGMDIALCVLDLEKRQLNFAGAYNPLILVRNGELIQYNANKQPVGKFDRSSSFSAHNIEVQAGDQLYIYSDGFADQFGGTAGRKMFGKRFKELLLEFSDLPLEEQKLELENFFNDWKGELEQIDDVCVMGVRV